jgi:hypothetical protein
MTAAALVGRFYGDGLEWAMAMPLPKLLHLLKLRNHVRAQEAPAPVVIYRSRT